MKTCLVTGANGGIGQALVKRFREDGYFVIGTDRDSKQLGSAVDAYIQADLFLVADNEETASSFFTELTAHLAHGRLDVLINNAALQVIAPIDALTRNAWHTTLGVNLLAPFFLVQGLANCLTAASGCVINMSSVHASLTKPGFAAYSTGKAALSGLTRALSIEYGDRFRVNEIAPAAIETEMLKAGFLGKQSLYEKLNALHPVGRIGRPSDLAQLALMIADPKLGFLNGASIEFDGGISHCLLDPVSME